MDQSTETMKKLLTILPNLAGEVVSDLFSVKMLPARDWALVPRLQLIENFEIACTMGASNNRMQAILMCGCRRSEIKTFVPNEEDQSIQLDALGEFLNNLYAVISSNNDCVNLFDVLYQAPPSFATDGGLFFPRVEGIQGLLCSSTNKLLVGFAAKRI